MQAPNGEQDIAHISWGGIALAEPSDENRHWSTWTINLIDGGTFYGWESDESISFPHTLEFELAGVGTIRHIALDSRVDKVTREDGQPSQTGSGSPVRGYTVLGSTVGADGPFEEIASGEAAADELTVVSLPEEVDARWLRLRIDSNWAGGGQTRLSQFSVYGELAKRGAAGVDDVSGVYSHEYGEVRIRQAGNEIWGSYGTYGDGLGTLRGTVYGRIIQVAWFEEQAGAIGPAIWVAAQDRLYGLWYRAEGKMGSPWTVVRERDLTDDDLETYRGALFPSS